MRRPIEDVGLTEVLVRVSYRLVQLQARRPGAAWRPYPATYVYTLAEMYRSEGFTNIYWTLNQCARWLATGYTMVAWRDELRPDQQMRAMHKQRGRAQ